MKALRTPDTCFQDLAGFAYTPHYCEVSDFEGGSLRMAYIDEGPRAARPVALFHGEPTWSYLYRKMIPPLLAKGHRVLAPDLIGMGRSDKPAGQDDYSYDRHVQWMLDWLAQMDLRGAVWFGQDWGSLIGLGMIGQAPERFDGIVLANGLLPDVANLPRMMEYMKTSTNPGAFGGWQAWIKEQSFIDCGGIISDGIPGSARGHSLGLSDAERAAYNAPYPDGSYQAGALVFPFLAERMNAGGMKICVDGWKVLETWQKPLVTAYGKADPVLGWADKMFQDLVPGAKGQPHREFPNGTHFIQEEEPQALADVIDDLVQRLG